MEAPLFSFLKGYAFSMADLVLFYLKDTLRPCPDKGRYKSKDNHTDHVGVIILSCHFYRYWLPFFFFSFFFFPPLITITNSWDDFFVIYCYQIFFTLSGCRIISSLDVLPIAQRLKKLIGESYNISHQIEKERPTN